LVFFDELSRERLDAVSARDEAQQQRENADKLRVNAEAAQKEEANQRAEAQRQRERAEMLTYLNHVQAAHFACQANDIGAAVAHLDQCRRDLRGWEYYYVRRLCNQSKVALRGHLLDVTGVAVSPDGTRIVSASKDQTVKIWDAATGKEALTFQVKTPYGLPNLVFSPDGRRIAGSYFEGPIKVWDAATGKEITSINWQTGAILSVAFSPDGKRIVSFGGDFNDQQQMTQSFPGEVKVWDATTGQESLTLKGIIGTLSISGSKFIADVAISADGKRIVSYGGDHMVRLWDIATGHQKDLPLEGLAGKDVFPGGVTSVAISKDGRWIVGGTERTVHVWDSGTGKLSLSLKATASVISVAISSNGKRIVSGSLDGTIMMWDAATGEAVLTLKEVTKAISMLAISGDGQRFVSAADNTIRVWDAAVGPEAVTLKGPTANVFQMAISPDGKRIASTSLSANFQRPVIIWDPASAKQIVALKEHSGIQSFAFSPDGERLLTASSDHSIKVWEVLTGREIITLKDHKGPVVSAAFNSDGKRIVSVSGDVDFDRLGNWLFPPSEITVWDAHSGQELLSIKNHTTNALKIRPIFAFSVAVSPDDKLIFSAGDGTAKVWDAATGKEMLALKGDGQTSYVQSVAISRDGKRIVSGSRDSTVKVWDAATGQEELTLRGHRGEVTSVAISRDGKRIFSAGRDEVVKVWDAATGQEALTLRGHTGTVSQLAISNDDRLFSCSYDPRDGTIKVWDAPKD
jgi:WD40 repeat protein